MKLNRLMAVALIAVSAVLMMASCTEPDPAYVGTYKAVWDEVMEVQETKITPNVTYTVVTKSDGTFTYASSGTVKAGEQDAVSGTGTGSGTYEVSGTTMKLTYTAMAVTDGDKTITLVPSEGVESMDYEVTTDDNWRTITVTFPVYENQTKALTFTKQ